MKRFEILAKLHGLDLNKNEHNYLNHTTEMCHTFYTARQSDNLKLALDIARAASCFDDLQSASLGGVAWHEAMAASKAHIASLHDIAIKLAGEDVNSVYCPDDSEKVEVVS